MTDSNPLALPPILTRIRALVPEDAGPVHLVGGAVRDALLGRESHDLDLVVAANAIELTFRLADALRLPAYRLDEARDVGRIVAPGQQITLDIARYRGADLAADLRARDFTINAMALPLDQPQRRGLIDNHGGVTDLDERTVRTIHAGSLRDDPVRALRAVRFALQLGFELAPETVKAIRPAAGALRYVSAERIRDELVRILAQNGYGRGITLLHVYGLLQAALPEIAALEGIEQSPPHREAVLDHTLSVMAWLEQVERLLDSFAAPENGWQTETASAVEPYREPLREHLARQVDGGLDGLICLRVGALFHDVGKRQTQSIDANGRIRFLGHDKVGAELARGRLNALAFSNEAIRVVTAIVAGHMRPLHLANNPERPSRRVVYRYFRHTAPAGLDIPLLAIADHLATYDGRGDETAWLSLVAVVERLFQTYFTEYEVTVAPPRLLDGRDLIDTLSVAPGPEVGRLLRLLEEAQAAGEVTTRAEAVDLVRANRQ